MTPRNYVVTRHGEPKIKIYGSAMGFSKDDTMAIFSCDLDRKGCEIAWTGSYKVIPRICIIDKKGGWTEIQFPALKGWEIWCSDIQRCTLRICFIKP